MSTFRNLGLSAHPVNKNEKKSSVTSRVTGVAGPSPKEPALITSKWGIGWQTLTGMIACYALGLNHSLQIIFEADFNKRS